MAIQMTPGSVMMAERTDGPGFVQFALLTGRAEWSEVEFGLPKLEWSARGFEAVHQRIDATGFTARLEQATDAEAVSSFLRVRVSGPHTQVREACRAIIQAAAEGLGWTAATFDVHFDGGLRPRAQRGA
jgi:hypothetical protein